jgi:hypothetical protein
MAVFAVIAPAPNDQLDEAVSRNFPGNFYVISPGQYLVSGRRLTTNGVAQKLGVVGGAAGRVLILPVLNYKGWHARDMWEWIAAQSIPRTDPPPSDPPEISDG